METVAAHCNISKELLSRICPCHMRLVGWNGNELKIVFLCTNRPGTIERAHDEHRLLLVITIALC
jgi:hypothetical protein